MRVLITPADVGKRVSVRSRQAEGEHLMTDAVGYLVAWSEGVLQIRRRDESIALIAEDDLLAGKVLPGNAPARRSERYPQ